MGNEKTSAYEAVRWYRLAAEQGDVEAKTKLASMHYSPYMKGMHELSIPILQNTKTEDAGTIKRFWRF
jgi:TPR repeat protein